MSTDTIDGDPGAEVIALRASRGRRRGHRKPQAGPRPYAVITGGRGRRPVIPRPAAGRTSAATIG